MPDLGDDVFLSPAMDEVVAEFRTRHASIFSLALRLNRYAHSEIFSTEVPRQDTHAVLIACLMQRSVSTFQAIVLLASYGMPSEAAVLLRTLVEITFKLAAIAKDPEVGNQYVSEDLIQRLRSVKKLMKLSQSARPSVADEELQTLLESIQKEISDNNSTVRTAYWFAEKAEITDLYHATYSVLSNTVHVNVRDLAMILESTEDGEITGFNYGPSDDGIYVRLLSAIESQIICLENAFTVLPATSPEVLTQLRSEFSQLFEKREEQKA